MMKKNYQVLGLHQNANAPLIWLTHGAGGDLKHFDTVIPVLIESGFQVLLADVRFHGLSQPKGDQTAIESASFDFKDIMDDMNWVLRQVKRDYYPNDTIQLILGGLSMGGMISLLYASQHEEWQDNRIRLRGIILLAAGIPYLEVDRPGWELFKEGQVTPELFQFAKSAIIASSIKDPGQCLVAIANLLPSPSNPPKPYQLLTTVPMLLVMPDGDPYTKLEMEKLHETNISNGVHSEAVIIKDSGHMVIIDQGSQVGVCIKDFCLKL
ncbi:unnamed protein product [Mucor hiemalis]